MFKKITFALILVGCFLSFNAVITPAQPAQASIIGEPCSVHWVDRTQDGWPYVTNTWLDSCPISCPVDVAGDIHTGETWCADFTPPPNLPGVYLGNACTGSTSRTVTLITDGTLGTSFEIEGNGQVVSGTSHTFTGIPEGLFTARGQAHNSKGSSGWSSPATAQHDYSAPTTSTNLVGLMGDNNWYISPVSISFSASDVGCLGVNQIAYTVNGGTQASYTGTPFTVSNEGVNSLLYRATDGFNLENTQSATFGIDTQQPDLDILLSTASNGAGWWNTSVAVAISASDATSGLASALYDVNGTGLVPYTGGIILATDGIHTFDAQVSDNAGHVVYDGVVIQIDSIAPTLLPSVTGSQNGTEWFISPATLTLTADDVTSGVAGMGYIVNGGSLNLYSSPVLFGTDGVYTIEAVAVDVALNMTNETLTILVDNTAPNLAIYLDGERGENMWFITPPTFILTANDTTSGVGERVYAVENGGWNTYTAPVTITREGLYTIVAEVRDVATNSTSHTFQIGYDITPPQTNAQLTETEDGMTITLNRWDGVSGYALTRMAINGVWGDYHHPVTVSEVGEYWVQFYTIDFAGNIEAEKIASFTIAETGVVVTQVPPVVNIIPPANPPTTPPFETRDDFPPELHDENLYFVSPPPTTPPFETREDFPPDLHDEGVYYTYPEDNRIADTSYPPSQIIFAGGNANNGSSVMPMENRISRIPRPILDESALPNVNSVPQPNVVYANAPNIIETLQILDVPESQTAPATIQTASTPITANNPVNGALATLATLGIITASAGAIRMTATALAKKKRQDEAKSAQMATLQKQQSAQAQTAVANWATNQTMQASAKQAVVTQVMQSQAFIDFQSNLISWAREARLRQMLNDLDGTIFEVDEESTGVQLAVFRIKQAWDRAIQENLMSSTALLSYEQDLAQCFVNGIVDISNLQSLITSIYEYNINLSQNMSDDESKIALSRLFASSLHITAYFDEISVDMGQTKSGLDTFNEYFTKTIVGEETYPVTLYLGANLDDVGRVDEFTGYVPLHQSQDKNNPDTDRLSTIYLGSEVSVATITHELFHQLDRHWGEELISGDNELSYFEYLKAQENYVGGLGLPTFDTRYLIGRAANDSDRNLPPEVWADNGMTAVLNGQQINLSDDENWSKNALVSWSSTNNAPLVAIAFKEYIFNLLQMGE